jgi:hypothetical protein
MNVNIVNIGILTINICPVMALCSKLIYGYFYKNLYEIHAH